MKKTILTVLLAGSLLTACDKKGEKATTKDAETVAVSSSEGAAFSAVSAESNVAWRASHLGGVQPRYGKISLKSAEVMTDKNKISAAKIVIDMASLTVENFEDADSKAKLTGHLLSDDFFKVETYPTTTFELTSIADAQGDYNSTVTGNLTILDVSKSITFNANVIVSESAVSIKSEDFVVDRKDWGLVYHVEGSEGVPTDYLIADDIGFTINVSVGK